MDFPSYSSLWNLNIIILYFRWIYTILHLFSSFPMLRYQKKIVTRSTSQSQWTHWTLKIPALGDDVSKRFCWRKIDKEDNEEIKFHKGEISWRIVTMKKLKSHMMTDYCNILYSASEFQIKIGKLCHSCQFWDHIKCTGIKCQAKNISIFFQNLLLLLSSWSNINDLYDPFTSSINFTLLKNEATIKTCVRIE